MHINLDLIRLFTGLSTGLSTGVGPLLLVSVGHWDYLRLDGIAVRGFMAALAIIGRRTKPDRALGTCGIITIPLDRRTTPGYNIVTVVLFTEALYPACRVQGK